MASPRAVARQEPELRARLRQAVIERPLFRQCAGQLLERGHDRRRLLGSPRRVEPVAAGRRGGVAGEEFGVGGGGGCVRVGLRQPLDQLEHERHARPQADPAVVVPCQVLVGRRMRREAARQLDSRRAAAARQHVEHRRRHVEVQPALRRRQADVRDPVAVARQPQQRLVAAVLHRAHDRAEERRQPPVEHAARLRQAVRPLLAPAVVRLRHPDVLLLVRALARVGVERAQVDRERRPRRDRRVEEVDGEVARDAAVGEPARRRERRLPGRAPLAVDLARPVDAMQRHRAEQHGEAEAHARRDHHREVVGRRERPQRKHALGVATGRRVGLHVGDDALREQPAQLVGVEPERAVVPRQPPGRAVGHVRRHHLQPQAGRPQLAERERPGGAAARAGKLVDQVGQPRRQRLWRAAAARRAAAEPVAVLGQQPRRTPREERRQPDEQPAQREQYARRDPPPAQQPAAVDRRQDREHDARREQRRGGERVVPERREQRAQRPARRRAPHHGVQPPHAPLRLEQVEQVAPGADPRRQPRQLVEPALGAPELSRRGGRGRDRARRRPADALEAVRLRELADGVRIHDAARDPALHHDVALERGGGVVGLGQVGHGIGDQRQVDSAQIARHGSSDVWPRADPVIPVRELHPKDGQRVRRRRGRWPAGPPPSIACQAG
jgi:hypothetical protein